MLPLISSIGLRRVPSVPGSTAATPSTSSAPMVSATCASFGPYNGQSTWIDSMLVAEQPAPSPPASHRRSRWTARRSDMVRGSGANARKPPTASCRSRARTRDGNAIRVGARLHGQPSQRPDPQSRASAIASADPDQADPAAPRRSPSRPASRSALQAAANDAPASACKIGEREAGDRHTAGERRRRTDRG